MLNQAWVDKILTLDLDSPDIVGPPRCGDDDKRDAWALKYIARMVEKGVPIGFAIENYHSSDKNQIDYSSYPEDAADDEMSYWDADE